MSDDLIGWHRNRDGTFDAEVDVSNVEIPDMTEHIKRELDPETPWKNVWVQCVIFSRVDPREAAEKGYDPKRIRQIGRAYYISISGRLYHWSRRGTAFVRAFGKNGMYERAASGGAVDLAIVHLTLAESKPNSRY